MTNLTIIEKTEDAGTDDGSVVSGSSHAGSAMDGDLLVQVEGVSKKFCKNLKRSLVYGIQDLGNELIGRNPSHDHLRKDEFWAVSNVSFTLRRGECLGLIGHNGAGKSTLLKMLNGLLRPDVGRIEINGRVGALIELGTGFNPILSGRENIYVNAQLLGFSREEIDERLEDIIEFSEIREFIDAPVRTYSSGMKVRLGFSIASQMSPDVLIIDEVLAVGDLGFRMKCLTKLGDMLANSAVIFVSHQMSQVARISNKVLMLDHGRVHTYTTDVPYGLLQYFNAFKGSTSVATGDGKVILHSVSIAGDHCEKNPDHDSWIVLQRSTIRITLSLESFLENGWFHISIGFIDKESRVVANLFSLYDHDPFSAKGRFSVTIETSDTKLTQGQYALSLTVNGISSKGTRQFVHLYNSNIGQVVVTGKASTWAPVIFNGTWSVSSGELENG
ncbi:MAG: ABC transporter ATP-binding protein [Bacteroidetes bacterium]|nr:ABC transporter ATP-binding protein [Bacteroidota bacterium]